MTEAIPLSVNRLGDREVLECGSPLPLSVGPGWNQGGRRLPHCPADAGLSRAGLRPALPG